MNYAIGSENQNLPAFVAFTSGTFSGVSHDASNWGAGFLPSQYQGVPFRAGKDPVLYISNPEGVDLKDRRAMLDVIAKSLPSAARDFERSRNTGEDQPVRDGLPDDDIRAGSRRYQQRAGKRSRHVWSDVRKPGSFARNCLLARRLAERDVRFISVMHVGWDHHTNIVQQHPPDCPYRGSTFRPLW